MASLEVVYHFHCLNFLRKATYFNFEYYKNDAVFDDPYFPAEERIGESRANVITYSDI